MRRKDVPRHAGLAWRLALAGVIVLCAGDAFAQYTLRQSTTASSGVGTVMTPCYALSSTAGEAITDTSSAGSFRLYSGFWGAGPATPRNSIFRDGFEDCSP
jgi:hypothetical protein